MKKRLVWRLEKYSLVYLLFHDILIFILIPINTIFNLYTHLYTHIYVDDNTIRKAFLFKGLIFL